MHTYLSIHISTLLYQYMCLHIPIYICIDNLHSLYIHTHKHTYYINICAYTFHIHICIDITFTIHMHTYLSIHISTLLYQYMCLHIPIYICIDNLHSLYIHTHKHTYYINICAYTFHIHICIGNYIRYTYVYTLIHITITVDLHT